MAEFRDLSSGKGPGLPGSYPDSKKPEKLYKNAFLNEKNMKMWDEIGQS